jgi:Flp pilus assembly protein protease CpaA
MFVVPLSVVAVVVLAAACTDVWGYRIPNVLTLPLFLSGLAYHAFIGQTIGLSGSAWGVLVGTLPFVALYAMGGMGAGDLKLMAGVGAWLGPWFTVHVIIVSGLATGCFSAFLMIRNRLRSGSVPRDSVTRTDGLALENDRGRAADVTSVLERSDRRSNAVPFGAMVALGVAVTPFWIGWFNVGSKG